MQKYFNEDYKEELLDEEVVDSTYISGAGGGCFPAGSLVKTAHGTQPIEKCFVGDMVLGYDKFGEVEFALVSAIHIHEKHTYLDDLYFIYSNEVSLFPFGITGNHAVYELKTNTHKEISEFKIGDKLLNLEGIEIEITSISITTNAELPDTFNVYNLTIEPQHTFFTGSEENWIRVHNGGGGKKGSSPHVAQEAPNTLRSSAIAKVLEIISYGPIVGINGGAKGVYFNNTLIQNPDNSYNFAGITFAERTGTASQTYIAGFNDTESEVLLSGNKVISGTPVIEQLPDTNISVVRATIRLNEGLWAQNKTNGDMNGFTVQYQIHYRTSLIGTWNLAIDKTIAAKSTSPYEIAHRISAPSGSVIHSVKVTRISADDVDSSTRSVISFPRLTQIIEEVRTYNNIALVGITIPAESVGNQIPVRAYDISGIKVKIPNVYNPVTRVYSGGYWNGGTTTVAWTDNPAWILYDLITNVDYGMATFLGQPVDVDVFSFFEAAMYNDCVTWNGTAYSTTLITNGNGGTEVRYKFNAVIATQSDAWQLLHAVASNMRALLVMKGTQISILQDRPRNSTKIITTSNVLDGNFLYSGSEVTSRATAINCTFNDRLDRYLPRTISEQDNIAIGKYGYIVKDIVAFGCVDESQARRMAKWALYTEINQYDTIAFSMALNIVDMAVGQVISVLDENYISTANTYTTGKVVSATGFTIVLDKPLTISAGVSYTFGLMSLDYSSIISYSVSTGAGTNLTTITLATSVAAGNYTNYDYFCYSTGTPNPVPFIIQAITEGTKGIYSITGIKYVASKYAYIEGGLVAVPPTYTPPFATSLSPVSNISFNEVYMNDGIASNNYIGVDWLWDSIAKPITSITRVGTVATVTAIAHGYSNGNAVSISGITNSVLYNGIFVIANVTANTFTYTMAGTPTANAIIVGIINAVKDLHTTKDVVTFNLRWRRDNNNYAIVTNLSAKSFQIPDTTPGNYEVTIEVINMQGKKSLATYATYAYRIVAGTSTLLPPTNFYVLDTVGTVFTDTHIPLTWTYPTANSSKTDTLLDYILETWYGLETTPRATYIIKPDIGTKNGSFDYTALNNINDFTSLSRSVTFKLYSRDMVGDKSTAIASTFTNPSPAIQSFTIFSGVSSVFIRITTATTEADIRGYKVWRKAGSAWSAITDAGVGEVYDGPDTYITLNVPDTQIYYYGVAAYDIFSKTELTLSSLQSNTALTTDAITWSKTGIVFAVGTTNQLTWTLGTIVKAGTTTYTIVAGNATWATGYLYAYFNPAVSTTVIQTTTSLSVAVGIGCYAIATYTGGAVTNIKGGTGEAFISGSQIIAGTVGASQIIAGSIVSSLLDATNAVITGEAQIGSAVINNAAIKDVIQSTNYNTANHTGWKLDKAGNITTYGALQILDNTGATVLSSGTSPTWNWTNITGTARPADNADVTNYSDTRVSNVIEENSTLTVSRPIGASLSVNVNAQVGAIKITLPQSWTSTMMSFDVDVFNYSADRSFSLHVAGYNGTSSWYNTSANMIGSTASNNRVRFGHDGVKCCIWIGETTSTWEYPKVVVKNFVAGYVNYARAQWESGWAIQLSTVAPPSVTADWADSLIDAATIKNQGSFATVSQITSGNVSTYIAAAAIGTAYIADAAITTAKIGDLQVDSLQIRGNAVTYITTYTATAGSVSFTINTHGTPTYPTSLVVIAKNAMYTNNAVGYSTLSVGGVQRDQSMCASSSQVFVALITECMISVTTTGAMTVEVAQSGTTYTGSIVVNVLEIIK